MLAVLSLRAVTIINASHSPARHIADFGIVNWLEQLRWKQVMPLFVPIVPGARSIAQSSRSCCGYQQREMCKVFRETMLMEESAIQRERIEGSVNASHCAQA